MTKAERALKTSTTTDDAARKKLVDAVKEM